MSYSARMKVASSRSHGLRRQTALAGAALLAAISGVSCASYEPPPPDGNVFVGNDGRPRYGYGGRESPNAARDRAAAGEPNTAQRKKAPDIKRDPNNTTVDVTPPPRKKTPPVDTAATPPDTEPAAEEPAAPPIESGAAAMETPKPAAPAREDLPFGQPVVGKKGFVYSPYASDKGYVDVTGIPAGTKVECPYTKKHFRVP